MSEQKNAFTGAHCQHVRMNGQRCTQPARRNSAFCRFHTAALQTVRESRQLAEQLPVLEDMASVQIAIMKVVRYLMTRPMDTENARAILSALRLASMNLTRDRSYGEAADTENLSQSAAGDDPSDSPDEARTNGSSSGKLPVN